MATLAQVRRKEKIHYPDSDGKPMGETPIHRDNLAYIIEMLRARFALDNMVYVSGNMFVYYVPGNRYRSLVPDVFVVKGVPRDITRRVFLTWEEKGLDLVIELTSLSSKDEDLHDKFDLYQNTLKVPEYFLFDPWSEYLDPPLQGYRLRKGKYQRIKPVRGRLPSQVLGLHLKADGKWLRLFDPMTRAWLLSPPEEREARLEAENELAQAEAERAKAQDERIKAEIERDKTESENERLQRELEALRRQLPKQE